MKIKLLLYFSLFSLVALPSFAQNEKSFSKQQADKLLLDSLVFSDLDYSDVFEHPVLLHRDDTILLFDGSYLIPPFEYCWYYFVDNLPLANWVHPCKYVFISAQDGSSLVIPSELPPYGFDFYPLRLFDRQTTMIRDNNEIPMQKTSVDNPHLYAVLICGTENTNQTNEYRFKNDMAAVYSTLVNTYGYMKEHIYVLFEHGYSEYGDDLDGDGTGDIQYDAEKETITRVFDELSGKTNNISEIPELDIDDQLFIFVDDHGGRINGISYFSTPTGVYYDTTMAKDLEAINCAQMTVLLQPCKSGGFPVRLTDYTNYNANCRNRSVHSSSDNEFSYAEGTLTNIQYDEFTYYWVAAARGYYPACDYNNPSNTHPWNNSYQTGTHPFTNYPGHGNYFDFFPDTNADGFVQMEEIFYYANYFDSHSTFGFYNGVSINTENPQHIINLGFYPTETLLTLSGLSGYFLSSHNNIDNRSYLCNILLGVSSGDSVVFKPNSNLFVSDSTTIQVNNGAALTLQGLVKLGTHSKMTINNGGRVYIHGGHLSGFDGKIWEGVWVKGNTSQTQQPVNGWYQQGFLSIDHGAVIEDAETALNLYNSINQRSGGIVFADSAVFRNNIVSLYIPEYHDPNEMNSSTVISYNSGFSNCLFTIDDYYQRKLFSNHVQLENINGIPFSNCDFRIDNSGTVCNISGSTGVSCIDASPSFTDSCYFYNFQKSAIYALSGLLGNNTLTVEDAGFEKNSIGVFAINYGLVSTTGSDFYIGGDKDCAFGVYLDAVRSFILEDNSFNRMKNTNAQTFGIIVKDSNGVNDIHNNEFHNLYCGNLAQGVNWVGKQFIGLTYTCNENTNNDYDFYVLDPSSSVYSGVQIFQGSTTIPAGNTFSPNAAFHFYNGGDFAISYYYNTSNSFEIPSSSKLYNVSSIGTAAVNSCVSRFGTGSTRWSDSELLQRELDYYEAVENYNALVQKHGCCPDDPVIQQQMAQFKHGFTEAATDILRFIMSEPVMDNSKLRIWLGNLDNIQADYNIVASYLAEGDSVSAFTLANSLPRLYELSGYELTNHDHFMQLLTLYQSLKRTNRSIYELTDSELELVKTISDSNFGTSCAMAKVILEMLGRDTFIDCPTLVSSKGMDGQYNEDGVLNINQQETPKDFWVLVNPNPASGWITVDFNLPFDKSGAVLSIANTFGIVVKNVDLEGQQGKVVVDMSNISPGVYHYYSHCGGYYQTGTIIITK